MTERPNATPDFATSLRNTMTDASLGEKILSLFFPARCLFCGGLTAWGRYLCEDCENISTAPEIRTYNIKIGKRSKFLDVRTPAKYTGEYREAILKLKFRGHRFYADEIARFIYDSLGEGFFMDLDFITFVPMTEEKRKARGYNQSQLIAEKLSKLSGVELITAIKKIKDNRTQHTLSKQEREDNVRGVYALCADIKGQKILLVDDIITTGSTISECAAQLYKGLAASVCGVCAASVSDMPA